MRKRIVSFILALCSFCALVIPASASETGKTPFSTSDPESADTYLELADLYLEAGAIQKAIDILQKGIHRLGGAKELEAHLLTLKRIEKDINAVLKTIERGMAQGTLDFSRIKQLDKFLKVLSGLSMKMKRGQDS